MSLHACVYFEHNLPPFENSSSRNSWLNEFHIAHTLFFSIQNVYFQTALNFTVSLWWSVPGKMLGHDRTCCIRGMRGSVPWVWSFEGTFWEEHFLPLSHINQRVVWMQRRSRCSVSCFPCSLHLEHAATRSPRLHLEKKWGGGLHWLVSQKFTWNMMSLLLNVQRFTFFSFLVLRFSGANLLFSTVLTSLVVL